MPGSRGANLHRGMKRGFLLAHSSLGEQWLREGMGAFAHISARRQCLSHFLHWLGFLMRAKKAGVEFVY